MSSFSSEMVRRAGSMVVVCAALSAGWVVHGTTPFGRLQHEVDALGARKVNTTPGEATSPLTLDQVASNAARREQRQSMLQHRRQSRRQERHMLWENENSADAFPGEDIVAWVSFHRSGRTQIKSLLRGRAKRRGWVDPSTKKVHLCQSWLRHAAPGRSVAGHPVDEAMYPNCIGVEPGNAVTTQYGFCDLVGDARKCRYLVALREPIARMTSSYGRFCKSCGRKGAQRSLACIDPAAALLNESRSSSSSPAGCISFKDYAAFHGNVYTQDLSGRALFCGRTGESAVSPNYRECLSDLTDLDLSAALAVLRDPENLAFRLETVWDGGAIGRMAAFLDDGDMLNSSVPGKSSQPGFVVNPTELEVVREMLSFDIRLYEALNESVSWEMPAKEDVAKVGRRKQRRARRAGV